MRQKNRPAKKNAGKGGGNGMLNEREGKGQKRRRQVNAYGIEC